MPETPPPMDAAQLKEMMRQDWKMAAGGWRKWNQKLTAQGRPVTEALVRAVGARPGLNILDLASGAGDPALSLARAVAPRGHVTATDLVPEMLEVAQEKAHLEGLTNLSIKQADPEALPFAEGSFDAVTCRFGIMFFPDVGKALREVWRVLRPGGRAVFVAWGPPEQNPWLSTPMGLVMKYAGLPPPPPGMPHPFNFGAPGLLAEALKKAGFANVREEALSLAGTWEGSPREGWEMMREVAAPVRKALKMIPPDREKAMVAEILADFGRFHDGVRAKFPMAVNLGTGVH